MRKLIRDCSLISSDKCMAAGLVGKEKYEVTRNQAWWKVMAAYPRVYDSRRLQADCQEPGSAPGPYAR